MRLIALVVLGCISLAAPVSGAGPAWPFIGQLSGIAPTTGSLAFDCLLTDGTLNCHFTQVRISHPTPLSDDDITEGIKSMLAYPLSAQDCASFRQRIEGLIAGVDVGGVADSVERADAIVGLQPDIDYCDAPSAKTAKAVLAAISARQSQSCNIGTFPFDLSFSWNGASERWETVSLPSGTCGVVTAAHMEIDKAEYVKKYNFWTYGQQTLVTNKSGSDPLFGPCAERPNEAMDYSWKTQSTLVQCKYVEFKLFF